MFHTIFIQYIFSMSSCHLYLLFIYINYVSQYYTLKWLNYISVKLVIELELYHVSQMMLLQQRLCIYWRTLCLFVAFITQYMRIQLVHCMYIQQYSDQVHVSILKAAHSVIKVCYQKSNNNNNENITETLGQLGHDQRADIFLRCMGYMWCGKLII